MVRLRRSRRFLVQFLVLQLALLGSLTIGLVAPALAQKPRKPTVTKRAYGKLDKATVDLYTLTNANGVVLKAITYGAIVTELHLPDRNGKRADVVLGYDTLADYVKGDAHFGGLVGRVANRIKGAQFTLNGATHKLAANNGPDHLHGGPAGWDRKIWQATSAVTPEGPSVVFT
ncbi:MAG TPA: galactose-1-epimerase, partial [Polyangia bacterium]